MWLSDEPMKQGDKALNSSGQGSKNGAVDIEHGASKDGIRNYVQGASIPSKRLSSHWEFAISIMQHLNMWLVWNRNIFFPVQVKNKPCDGGTEERSFLAQWTVLLQTGYA
jgi:hypothetical protein